MRPLAAVLQVPLLPVGAFLALRSAMCIMANLTTNELYNRTRYLYLNHESAGYCNRCVQHRLKVAWAAL